MSRWVRAVAVAAVGLLVAGCSATIPTPVPFPPPVSTAGRALLPIPDVRPAGYADPPPGAGLTRYAEQVVTWRSCGSNLVCARVLVPLDYADPDGTAITLFMAKVPATAPSKLGTLFVNPGGPGGSGADFVNGFRPPGLTGYDLVGWDPRGVGRSTPVSCFGSADLDRYNSIDGSPDDQQEERTLLSQDRAFAESCLQRSGSLLQHISTEETVRDLDLLRGLVKAPRLDYLGFSYGTEIGARYAQQFPDRVGRMVLDGSVDPVDEGGSVSQVTGFERALGHFATWCAQQRCPLGGSQAEVLGTITRVLKDLDRQPLPAGRRTLSQQQGVQAVFQTLYGGQSGWRSLADELHAAAQGDGAALLKTADQANSRRSNGSYGQLEYAFPAVRCLDSQTVSVAKVEHQYAEDKVAAPVLGALSGPDFVCTQWPVAPAPPAPKITAAGTPPIVVVGTTGDPATPYEWAQSMAKHLDSGLLVTFAGEGHTAYGQSSCVRGLVDDYLIAGVVPKDGARC